MENARKVSKRIQRIRGKYLSIYGENGKLGIRGKYLNVFREYAERSYADMEIAQRDS
jgi:hypothetical protein